MSRQINRRECLRWLVSSSFLASGGALYSTGKRIEEGENGLPDLTNRISPQSFDSLSQWVKDQGSVTFYTGIHVLARSVSKQFNQIQEEVNIQHAQEHTHVDPAPTFDRRAFLRNIAIAGTLFVASHMSFAKMAQETSVPGGEMCIEPFVPQSEHPLPADDDCALGEIQVAAETSPISRWSGRLDTIIKVLAGAYAAGTVMSYLPVDHKHDPEP